MFQQIEVVARRANVDGFVIGPNSDTNFYWRRSPRTERPKSDRCGRHASRQRRASDLPRRRHPRSFSRRGPPLLASRSPLTFLRPAAGHLPDRPRRADRSGAGRRRRPRTGRRLRARAHRARPRPAALGAVRHLRRPRSLHGDFGRSVLTSQPRARRHQARLSGDARARDVAHPDRRRARRADGRPRGGEPRPLARPHRARRSAWSAIRCRSSGSG